MIQLFLSKKMLAAAAVALALVGCGGKTDEPVAMTLRGVAASGAALANASVTVVCNAASGSGTVTTTATTDVNGNYTVTAANGKPVCLLTVTKVVGGVTITLNSLAIAPGVTNITPATNMIVAAIVKAKGAVSVADLVKPQFSPGPNDMAKAQAAALTQINAALVAAGKAPLPVGTDLVNQANFTVGGATDKALDDLSAIGAVTPSGQGSAALQQAVSDAVAVVVPVNPPGATGGT